MGKIIELLRTARELLYKFSAIEVFGIHIDTTLHLIFTFILFFIFKRFTSVKKSIILIISLQILKEIFDLFAKSRIEYIRPPTVDLLYDLIFGFIGLFLALLISGNLRIKRKRVYE